MAEIIATTLVYYPDRDKVTQYGNLSCVVRLPQGALAKDYESGYVDKHGNQLLRVWLGKPGEDGRPDSPDIVYIESLNTEKRDKDGNILFSGDQVMAVKKGKGWNVALPAGYKPSVAPAQASPRNNQPATTSQQKTGSSSYGPSAYNPSDQEEKLSFLALAGDYVDMIALLMATVQANDVAKTLSLSTEDARSIATSAFIQATYSWPKMKEALMNPIKDTAGANLYEQFMEMMRSSVTTEPSERVALINALSSVFGISSEEVTSIMKATRKASSEFTGDETKWSTSYEILDSYVTKKGEVGAEQALKFIESSFAIGDW